jgi:hypothetical protein
MPSSEEEQAKNISEGKTSQEFFLSQLQGEHELDLGM